MYYVHLYRVLNSLNVYIQANFTVCVCLCAMCIRFHWMLVHQILSAIASVWMFNENNSCSFRFGVVWCCVWCGDWEFVCNVYLFVSTTYIQTCILGVLYLVKMILFSPSLFGLVISFVDGNWTLRLKRNPTKPYTYIYTIMLDGIHPSTHTLLCVCNMYIRKISNLPIAPEHPNSLQFLG